MPECKCMQPPFRHVDYESTELGIDDHPYPPHGWVTNAEVSIERCVHCGTLWLRYFIDDWWHSQGGRWWRAPVPDNQNDALTTETAKEYLESMEWCFVGGSFYLVRKDVNSSGQRIEKPIIVA